MLNHLNAGQIGHWTLICDLEVLWRGAVDSLFEHFDYDSCFALTFWGHSRLNLHRHFNIF